ncbi:hypothetical protein F3Y22_tig00116951pilonHSYRG00291 [Hibiscus syriacus]|uniref:PAP/OAS1 substrate-binding-related domain-containing protein n=1 Tax=Hibiscus syriacus TaxID=106335 RepID=A0A6A2WL56_HIBSY|nr:hypothetical protein F3Y22_tig00116951pilonHSYRG00291 [Hibiscus syriacus]
MGEYEGCASQHPPFGLLPNGLLPNEAASGIRILDYERWMKAEERTADLIACIQPDAPSEGRRNAVADYVQRLISKCFPCQAFTFGSVPLKTYLPDGDIDLTAFKVQYIQAEVKIIKCLVQNIVVDISFNQLGGLCTLCFLEEVDLLINQNHLFKRSIILIKAWCYYESRILGAHHGLISTYALETLVLYIFHVYNKPFSGPLEVLYRFLEFFSKFDWENFCVSLLGPVPVSSLPDISAEPPRRDGGELLLSKYFLDTCSSRYAVCQENQGQPFTCKYFNVIDPLRVNNNLGRSVSKGNFFRIRSAFAFGAKKLARLLDCPKEDLYYEVNQFFMNTWERHGSGQRPDAPRNDMWRSRLSNLDHTHGFKNIRNNSNSKGNDASSQHETQTERARRSLGVSSQHVYNPLESKIKINDASAVSRTQSLKSHGNMSHSKTSDQVRWDSNSSQNTRNGIGQRIPKAENVTDVQGRYLFARTCSSPELTETYGEVTSQQRRNRTPESGKTQIASTRSDNNRRKNIESDLITSRNIKSSCDDPSSFSQASSHQSIDTAADPNDLLNSYQDDLGFRNMSQEFSLIPDAQGMQQEEQDLVNMMAFSAARGFNGQVSVPLNLAAGHLPFPIQPLSMSYNQRNLGGILPTNIQMFPQGLVSSPLAHYFSSIGLASNPEDPIEISSENFGPPEMNSGEVERDLWHEHDRGSSGGFDLDNGSFEMLQSDNKQKVLGKGHQQRSLSQLGRKGVEEHGRDWDSPSIVGTEMAERTTEPQLSSLIPDHLIPGSETAQTSGSDPLIPIAPFLLDPGSGQRTMDNSGVPPLAFTITGPPIPFLLCPVYNIPAETGTPDASTNHFSWDEGFDNQSCQNLESSERLDQSEVLSNSSSTRKAASLEPLEHKSDILNGDIASHWQNLQYGRFCQNSRYPPPLIYPSPLVLPPVYLQGHFPWDGPGRTLSSNVNHFSQLMNYGPRIVSDTPLQSVSNRPASVYQRHADEMPRYRSGTGTYLPNPKVSTRERHSANARRGKYSYDRNDHHSDRDGNWNANSKSQAAGYGRSCNQNEKSRFTCEQSGAASGESRAERLWGSHRHDSYSSHQSHNGSVYSNSSQGTSADMPYGMYPLPAMNHSGVSSNGPTIPSVVMLYPYEHNSGYGSPDEQLDFGSLGPVAFSGMNKEVPQPSDGSSSSGLFDKQRFHGTSAQQSLDQPSSSHLQR